MDGARSLRGWLAALTVALTLTLVFLAVEKHIRIPSAPFFSSLSSVDSTQAVRVSHGVVLGLDSRLASIVEFPRSDSTVITRRNDGNHENLSAALMRRPPEPAVSVVLQAPVALDELTSLPLHGSRSKIEYLMEAMDGALASPMHSASAQISEITNPSFSLATQRAATLNVPSQLAGHIAQPKGLYAELSNLAQLVDPATRNAPPSAGGNSPVSDILVSRTPRLLSPTAESERIHHWLLSTRSVLDRVVLEHGLEHVDSGQDLQEMMQLVKQADQLGNTLTDQKLARTMLSVGYSLQRRVVVWQALRNCLQGYVSPLTTPHNPDTARAELVIAIRAVDEKLNSTGDGDNWRKYLMLDELTTWAHSSQSSWSEGNSLALVALSRLHWQRLSEAQQRFLSQAEFEELASHLLVWGRDAVDYRQLLTAIETLEVDPTNRVSTQLASSIQILRLSREDTQQQLAAALNDHYRNANLRLTLSEQMIQRLLPSEQVDSRPVRQNILGATTSGDSTVHTQLHVKLVPDPTAWNIGIGVMGDLVSMTRSSKGPAVFHSTSMAQIDCNRFVRIDPRGFEVSAAPTFVDSQDYLRNMSTDFDGLPLVGELARFLVREQFNQKRGLAKRITQRIIAREADAELDRRLEESLGKAERELADRIVGPLQRLNLNPLIVAMSTTEQRLSVRYRVANESQMGANTPRPRAPSDSLLSMQVHQSAINNTIEQIGLSGRLWTIPELYERLGEAFQGAKWKLPAELDGDVNETRIRFADSRPATVELVDGKLRLTLRIAEFIQGDRFHIERFIVTSSYVPAAEGMSAELIRDGVVEIVSNHDRLKLRVIFAKIFVSNPQIPLISESWANDPLSEGLAVSQVEIRDGWLSVAVSPENSEQAAQVAARAQLLRSLK